MAITLPNESRNAACNAIVDLIDAGSGAGTLEFKTAASTVAGTSEAATLTFSDPAFGVASAGVATANAINSDTNATGGTVGYFTIFDSDSNDIMQGTVAVSGADIDLSSLVVGATDTVSMSSLTATMPAS